MTGVGNNQDEALRGVARRRSQRRLRVAAVVLLLGVPVTTMSASAGGAGATVGERVAVTAVCEVLAGLGLALGFALVRRRPELAPTPVGGLDRRTRRLLLRDLRQGRPIPPPFWPMAAELVVKTRRARWLPIVYVGIGLSGLRGFSRAGAYEYVEVTAGVLLFLAAPYVAWAQSRVAARRDLAP